MQVLSAALESWEAVDLEGQKAKGDAQVHKFEEHDTRAKQARKNLAEITKALRKTSAADRLQMLGNVLKGYQEEVNGLTKRAQYAEGAFMGLYKALFDAPDPRLFLKQALKDGLRVQELERECKASKDQLADFDEEFQKLKNQEYTVRKLELENREYEQRMEARVAEAAAQNQTELEQQSLELKQQLEEQQRHHRQKLQLAKDDLTSALSARALVQARLFDVASRQETAESAADTEQALITEEVERANAVLEALRRENGSLRGVVARLQEEAKGGGPGMQTSSEDEAELMHLRSMLAATQDTHDTLLTEWLAKSAAFEASARERDTALGRLQGQVEELQAALGERPQTAEFEAVRTQLRILQEVEFNVVGDSGSQLSEAERMLLQKNKRLEAQLAGLRVELQAASETSAAWAAEVQLQGSRADENALLVSRLEQDLEAALGCVVQPAHERTSDAGESMGVGALVDATAQGAVHTGGVDAHQALLASVCGQRDRFKEKCEVLDRGNSELQEGLERFLTQVNALKTENLKLYEKLRYERSYSSSRRAGRAEGDLESGLTRRVEGAASSDGLESKYGDLYEEQQEQQTNPFLEFRKAQKKRGYNKLSAPDKITLSLSSLAVKWKTCRTFLFFYSLALHLLVFVTLYIHTLHVDC